MCVFVKSSHKKENERQNKLIFKTSQKSSKKTCQASGNKREPQPI